MIATCDTDIRYPLISWLQDLHSADPCTAFLQEFEMPRPSARIDLAVVNGEMAGFEIKSDRDTLTRLDRQVPAFSRFFDKVSLVTTRKHLKKARLSIPDWWGIILFEPVGSGPTFKLRRKPKQNRHVHIESMLYTLSKDEITEICKQKEIITSSRMRKAALVSLVAASIPTPIIQDMARSTIRARNS